MKKVIRFIFAPFFWLRDIRNRLEQIRRILMAHSIVGFKYSPLTSEQKKMLVAFMIYDQRGGEEIRDRMNDATSLLKTINMED